MFWLIVEQWLCVIIFIMCIVGVVISWNYNQLFAYDSGLTTLLAFAVGAAFCFFHKSWYPSIYLSAIVAEDIYRLFRYRRRFNSMQYSCSSNRQKFIYEIIILCLSLGIVILNLLFYCCDILK